jgi:hypothetical protein
VRSASQGSRPSKAAASTRNLFETAPGGEGGILGGYDRVPNPFVLAPWEEGRLLQAWDEAGFRLVLIGRAIEHAHVARQAVVEAGLRRLGPDRGALDLISIDSVTAPPIGPCSERVATELLSPLRLVEVGRLVGPTLLRPRHLLLRCCVGFRPSPSGTGRRRSSSITVPSKNAARRQSSTRSSCAGSSGHAGPAASRRCCKWAGWSARCPCRSRISSRSGRFSRSPPECMSARARRWGSARCG